MVFPGIAEHGEGTFFTYNPDGVVVKNAVIGRRKVKCTISGFKPYQHTMVTVSEAAFR